MNSILYRRRKTKPPKDKVIIEYTDWTKFLPWLTQLAFVFAIALVVARAMMLEPLRESFEFSGNTAPPRQIGPAGSIVLDLLCCLPALLVLLRRVFDKTYIVRLTWAEALLAGFALWAMLSTLWAGDKFASLILSCHLLAAAALLWATAQLVRSWMRLRIVAGACTGLLLIFIMQGIFSHFIDLPDFIKDWKEHRRTEVMQQHGWQESDFGFQQFEKKVLGGEMIGFQASPNTFAAAIVLVGMVVLGAGLQRISNKDDSGMIGITLLPLPVAMWIVYYTHSNTAFATPVIAAMILVAIGWFGAALSRKRRVAFAGCCVAVVLGTVGLIGHGLFHESLPTASLNFRWRYWVASMHVFAAHPIVGVGYGNFGYWYLGARLPAAAEEIKDPHNLVVRAMTELGIVGALLLLGWLVRIWWEWTLPNAPGAVAATPASTRKHGDAGVAATSALKHSSEYDPWKMFATIASISILALLVKIFAGVDLGTDAGFVEYELLKHLVFGALLLIGLAIVAVHSVKDPALDNRPAPWLLYGTLAGLAVFLIHNTIDFSLFEVGPMMLFMLIGGAVLGVRSPSAAGLRKRTPVVIGVFAMLTIIWLIGVIFLAVPLIDAENRAHAGDNAIRKQDFRLAAEHYNAAFMNAPAKNADYASRAAQAWMALPDTDALIRVRLSDAVAASPQDSIGYLSRARYMLKWHPDARSDIRRDYDTAVGLNPNDLDTRLEYARVLEEFGDRNGAAEQYRVALKVNDGFDATEPKRFSEVQLKEIDQKVKRLAPSETR